MTLPAEPADALSLLPQDVTQLAIADLKQATLDLFCTAAYREGDFALTSGQRSSYYINGKQVALHPQGIVMVGRLMLAVLPADTVAVAGLTLGADPLVSAVSVVAAYEQRAIAPLIVRKEAKGHGTQAYIEGLTLPPGSPVVVLEDVVTTGQSAMKAVTRLRDSGYEVNQVLAMVDREEGGAALYAKEGLQFSALFAIGELKARWAELHPIGVN